MSWFRHLYFRLLYFRRPPWDTQESPPELLEFISKHPPGRALDLGCGTGTNVITLAGYGWQATGVDFVGRSLKHARIKAQLAGATADFLVDDVTTLKLVTGKFDLILDIGCFHSLSGSEKLDYLKNLERLTKPRSFYLMYGFTSFTEDGGPGIREPDLHAFDKDFILVNREDGTERGQRPSAWFTFQRKSAE